MMKKLLIIIIFTLTLVSTSYAQYSKEFTNKPITFDIHGGYSYLNGVAGVSFQYKHWSIGGGWMPQHTLYYNKNVPSWGIAATWYTGYYYEGSLYLSMGAATAGYVIEDQYTGYYDTNPTAIVMIGYKIVGHNFYCKFGFGYSSCKYDGNWTGEAVLGHSLFNNKYE